MNNSYLLEVIKALRESEQQEISRSLLSAASLKEGNCRDMYRLYQLILDTAPAFDAEILEKKKVYVLLFPEQKEIPGKLEKLMSELNKFVREALLSAEYFAEQNEEERQIDWAAWLRKRGLAERSQKTIAKLKTQHDKLKDDALEHYRLRLLLAQEAHEWESSYNHFKSDLHIPELLSSLDQYYFNYRTELQNRYLVQQKVTKLPDLRLSTPTSFDYLEESILLSISLKINEFLNSEYPTIEHTQYLISLLSEHEHRLTYQALYHFYAYLRNFCTLLIDRGNLNFIPLLHEIHKENLQRGYFFTHGEISPTAYINLVQVAIRAQAYDWAKSFTESFKNRILGGDETQFFYRLNTAQCLFSEGKFEDALDFLPDNPVGLYYQRLTRRLELKLLYELNSELLPYKTDTFRKFIDRTEPKSFAPNLRTMDLNFLNLLLQLAQTPFKDKARSARLLARIEDKKLVSDRIWLMEKARELG